MNATARLTLTALSLIAWAGSAPPAQAICVSARLFTTGFSYIATPGCEASDCGADGSSVTDDFTGAFWAVGNGNGAAGVGIDNGSFPAVNGWLLQYAGYPALFSSTWAASTGIDGCIDFADDPRRCMAVLLQDRHPASGDGVFALLTRAPDALGNYDFEQSGDVLLAEFGRPVVVAVHIIDEHQFGVTVAVPGPGSMTSGLYLDPACEGPQPVVRGVRLYTAVRHFTDPAPTDAAATAWDPATGVIPPDEPVSFVVDCRTDESMWVRSGLVLDGGYSSGFLSEQSTRIECTRTLADPADPRPTKPQNRQRPRHREARP